MATATTTAPSTAAPPPAARPTPAPLDKRRLFTFICMVFGMFMAILDIQIVSASLAEIQAGLGASANEISWVQTAYLIAEVIMIPLSGYLSRMLSTRWLFAIAAGGFTCASLMCAMSTSINEMIVWRAFQGFIGGGMIPTVFASAFIIFPRAQAADHLADDRPGRDAGADHRPDRRRLSDGPLLLALAVPGQHRARHPGDDRRLTLIDFDKPDLSLFDNFDWIGLAAMAVFLGASNTCSRRAAAMTGSTTAVVCDHRGRRRHRRRRLLLRAC